MGFSATTVRPQATPSHCPSVIVLPFTSFNARRKKTGAFSRRSLASTATANGQSFPAGGTQLGLLAVTTFSTFGTTREEPGPAALMPQRLFGFTPLSVGNCPP